MATAMDEILLDAMARYVPFGDGVLTQKAMQKLSTKEFAQEAELDQENLFEPIVRLLGENGDIIDLRPEEGVVVALVLSGKMNMNPTLLIVRTQGRKVEVVGAAKEGLINQHSGEIAVQRFFAALQQSV